MLQYRFFELAIGGLGAIVFGNRHINKLWTIPAILLLLVGLFTRFNISENYYLTIVLAATFILLTVGSNDSKVRRVLLENNVMVYLGKISFSLYMWHQIVIAFARYIFIDHIGYAQSGILLCIMIGLSALSYELVEKPFRNAAYVVERRLFGTLVPLFLAITIPAFYLFGVGGIWRNVPELGVTAASAGFAPFSKKPNPNIIYNSRIYDLDKDFTANNRKKVLVIGNSFSRDFANVLLESPYKDSIELSYVFDIYSHPQVQQRLNRADFIFFSKIDYSQLLGYMQKFAIDTQKVKNVGTKNFGTNNGIYYNNQKDTNYCSQRTAMEYGNDVLNNRLKREWRDKYINLIALVIDDKGKMPVYTDDCKFISQDTRYLTKAGASYFGRLINFNQIFGQ